MQKFKQLRLYYRKKRLFVIQQYLPGIACGSVDPETALPEFRQALKDAGYDDILAEKQKQLDAWLAAQ